MQPAITVICTNGGASCRAIGSNLTFSRVNGSLYLGSDGKNYYGGASAGIGVMTPVIDHRPPSPPTAPASPPSPGMASGSGSDFYGAGSQAHDWYLIGLALLVLYVVMRYAPKWGVPFGYLVLLGAILSTEAAVNGFNALVKTVQTGSIP